MFKYLAPEEIGKIAFVPQAIFTLPLDWFVHVDPKAKKWLHHATDELDEFYALYFFLAGQPIAIKSYNGFPKETTSLYMDRHSTNENLISETVRNFMAEFKIPNERLEWERRRGLPQQFSSEL